MIVFMQGGDDRQMDVTAVVRGMRLEEVVMDGDDFACLREASDEQLRQWVTDLADTFATKRGTRTVC